MKVSVLVFAALFLSGAPVLADQPIPTSYNFQGHFVYGVGSPDSAPVKATAAATVHWATPGACGLASTGVDGDIVCAANPVASIAVTDPISNTGTSTAPIFGLKFTNVSLKLSVGGALERTAFSGGDVTAPDDSNVLTIVPHAVTFAKMQTFAGPAVLGVATALTSVPGPITSTASGDAFWNNGTALQWSAYPYSALAGAPSSLPPSGAASGDLGLTYPAPTVLAAEFGATRLTFATTADGALLKRSGTTVGPAVPGTDYVVTVRADGIATGAIQLASLSAANMLDGAVAYVDTVDDFFKLQASTATADNITIVNASGKTGFRWMRMGIVSLRWQAVTTWNVDPSGGNDENDGAASALKTLAEWARRTHGIVVGASGVTVNLVGDVPDSDSLIVNFSGTGPSSFVLLNGGTSVVSTQTVSSAQARNAVSNLANEITTPGDLSAFVNDMVCLHGTTSCAFIVKAVGTGVARLSELVNGAGAQVASGGVTAGQTIDVLQTRKGPLSVSVNGNIEFFVSNVRFDGSGTVSFIQSSGGSAIVLQGSIIGGTSFSVSSTAGFDPWQTLFESPGSTSGGIFEGDAFTADVSFQTVAQQAGYAKLRSTFWQGAQCTVAGGVLHLDGDFATFDLPAGKSGIVLNGGTGVGEGAIAHWNSGRHYGSGNSGSANVWFVGIGSWVSYPAATPPTMNAGNGININGANVAVGSVPIEHNPITGSAVYALGGTATAGVLAQDTAGNLSPRSITSTGGSIVITNATGGGNINLEAAAAGLADPGSNGILVRTALNTTTARTLTNGDGTINFSFPDGVAGNPEIHVNAIPESKVTGLVTDLSTINTTLAGKQPTGNYVTGTASGPVGFTGPGLVATTINLGASGFSGALPLGDLALCSAGQVVGMVGGVQGCVTPSAGTVYTGLSPIIVNAGTGQISCPTCGTSSGSVTGVFGTIGQIVVTPSTPNPSVSLAAAGAGAGTYGGTGVSSVTLDGFGRVTGVGAATYLTSTGTTPGTYNNLTVAGSGLITGASVTSWMTAGEVMVSGGLAGLPVGDAAFTYSTSTHTATMTGSTPISLTATGAQEIDKLGGTLFVGTSSNNDVGLYSDNITRMWLRGSGAVQIPSLAAGGITKALVTTGELGIASSADIAATLGFPAATDVLISTGPSTAPTGNAGLTFASGNLILGNSVKLGGLLGNSVLFTDGSGFAATDSTFGFNSSTHTLSTSLLSVASTTTIGGDLTTSGAVTFAGYAGSGGPLRVTSSGFVQVGGSFYASATIDYTTQLVASGPGTPAGWLGVASLIPGMGQLGQVYEYPKQFAANTATLKVVVVHNGWDGTGDESINITRNGSIIGSTIHITPATAPGSVLTIGPVTVSGGATTDTYGVEWNGTGSVTNGKEIDATSTLVLQ